MRGRRWMRCCWIVSLAFVCNGGIANVRLVWPYVALPALKLVQPRMRPGSVVFVDNTISSEKGYKELLSVLRDPNGPWRSVTLPFSGGLEMCVYDP